MPPETTVSVPAPTTTTTPSTANAPSADGTSAPATGAPSADGSGAASPDAGAPATPETPSEKETAYYRSVRKREAELVARQERFANERKTVEDRHKSIETKEREIAEREQLLKSDPIAYAMKHHGFTDEDLARRWLNNGKPSQEEIERTREEGWRAELKKRDEAIEELRAKETAREKAAQEAQHREASAKLVRDFTAHAQSTSSQFPRATLALASAPDEAIAHCNHHAQTLLNAGDTRRGPALWSAALERFESSLTKFFGGNVAAPAAPQGAAPKGSEKPGQQERMADAATSGNPAPTLTGKGASARSSVPNDADMLALELRDPQAAKEKVLAEVKAAKKRRTQSAA